MNQFKCFDFKSVDAVYFDLDDTILVFDAVSEPAWVSVCEKYSVRLGIPADDLLRTIYSVSHDYWSDPDRHRMGRLDLDGTRKILVRQAFNKLNIHDALLVDALTSEYIVLREEAIVPFNGAIETLEFFASKFPLALITNGESHKQRWKIERFDLARYFRKIFIEQEVGFGKPDPRVYSHASSIMQIPPSRSVMIGDNLEWDVSAPQRLGMKGIWNDWRGRGLPDEASHLPDAQIRRIRDLII